MLVVGAHAVGLPEGEVLPEAGAAQAPGGFVHQKAGHQVTVRTSQQMHRVSTPVKPGQERPGDLLFSHFGDQKGAPGAAHVLIVVKRGTAVEAPRTGVPVRTRAYDIADEDMKIGRLPKSALPEHAE